MSGMSNWQTRSSMTPLTALSMANCASEFRELESLLHDLEASRQLDLKSQDHLLGFGECFSSRLVKEALCQAGIERGACRRAELASLPTRGMAGRIRCGM